jgi:hypothetical protein
VMSESPATRTKAALAILGTTATMLALTAGTALADFPYARPGADETDYTDLYTDPGQVPNDLGGDNNEFKYSATSDPANGVNNARPGELGGVRGAHVVDDDPNADTAWQITTGRPDVTLAVLDSGIEWDSASAMADLRFKTRLNQGELPVPNHLRSTPLATGADCTTFANDYDANGDNVFNLADYVCDNRVNVSDGRRDGPAGMLTPQDVLIAFSDGDDGDSNGYDDDIVGWDFLDDDNDPFDDVSYGHGTGEARGSTSEAHNQGEGGDNAGSCPNCMVIHMRVGDSFIADVNRFAAAVAYATDNDVEVVQSALGTLNNTTLARQSVEYAYKHGVTVILSAADEAAQHNNQPSLPHAILVNSVTRDVVPEPNRSYLAFNGCTNFNVKITIAIPSTSCSSDAVGVSSGLAGLIYSAAYNAYEKGALDPNQRCTLTGDGPDPDAEGPDNCIVSPSEVRQLLASGRIGPQTMVDDVDFAGFPGPGGPEEPDCTPPVAGCTDPNGAPTAEANLNRPRMVPNSFSYPARFGHDQFYGYGRVNTRRSAEALVDNPESPAPSLIPPEVELTSPEWYEQIDPARSSFEVRGEVWARGAAFTCRVLVAPGHYPDQKEAPDGDFTTVPSPGMCDGTTEHSQALDGKLADISVAQLKLLFPPDASAGPAADFRGRETGLTGVQTSSGRPNTDPYGFEVKVVAETVQGGTGLTGEDYRGAFLHRDQDLLPGFPKAITRNGSVAAAPATPTSDGESSPAFADLDGDNRNEMVFGTSDGFVHALRANGSELPGWPVRADAPPFVQSHQDARAYESGALSSNIGGAMLASVAVGDTNRNGVPEVYVADLEGKVYGWSANGTQVFEAQSNPAFSGAPLQPFVENRRGPFNRTQHGFLGSPVLADIDGDDGGRQEIVAAAMDRHLYAWERDGSPVDGFPVLVVDPSKVQDVDPVTHRITFRADSGSEQQGAIITTPAIGDINGDADSQGEDELPEILTGTNEEYRAASDGGFNASAANGASLNLIAQLQSGVDAFKAECGEPCEDFDNPLPLSPGNARLYAISARGDENPSPLPDGATIRPGWPAKLGIAMTGLLPVVGEGVTGSPVIAPAACVSDGSVQPRVGAAANNGPAYILREDGQSCYGRGPDGRDIPLQTDVSPSGNYDRPFLPAVGNPTFGDLGEPSPSFLLPAAGLFRALDLALPEYQRGQDYIGAWSVVGGGQFRPNYPATMNDLQFLTGPAVADLDGLPGEEVVEGSASKEVTALNAAGTPMNARWPKVTTDWTVATPLVGSFGTLDTADSARKVVVNMTRSGYVHAWKTDAPACTPSSSPRFHHDNANSGDYRRDAVLPGKPMGLAAAEGPAAEFGAPGDDLLCGTAERYELVTSDNPINEANFDQATPLDGAPEPDEAGAEQTVQIPPGARRYIAIRAVDEQGNVGRVSSLDFGPGGPDGSDGSGGPGDGGAGGPQRRCSTLEEGTNGRDTLRGDADSERIKAGGGRDKVKAGRGDDCVAGGGGRDKIAGQGGEDRIGGGKGADRLRGNGGGDRITGGTQPDRIDGGGGKDVIRGAGDDKRDRIHCGGGRDRVIADGKDKVKANCERVR